MSQELPSASASPLEVDDDFTHEGPVRVSTSSSSSCESSSCNPTLGHRPTTAPVANGIGDGHFNHNPPRDIRTAPTPTNNENDQNVRVVARVRPLSTKEINEQSGESIAAHPGLGCIHVAASSSEGDANTSMSFESKRKFEYDSVFGPSSTQQEVYDRTCGGMISSSIFRGFNATILAYGQTGSGKTFTMGTDGSAGANSTETSDGVMVPPSSSDGVIARAVFDLFQTKNSLPQGKERVKVTMSYLEIYNEQAIDLLNDESNATLQVRDSKIEGVVIPNLKHFPVTSPEEVRVLMERASAKRATGSTHMNSVSSRSHAICTLNVIIAPDLDGVEGDADGNVPSPRSASHGMRAKLTLVDLAGSERIKRTGAEGARLKEGININKGLFVLGQVVSALSELGQRNGGGHHTHIPYRDSKLTRLLQDSLGGNSRTVMIACISPAESNIEESINTLRYAERTRNIKNSAVRNVVSAGLSASQAAALRRENQQLKLELARLESKQIVSTTGGSFSLEGTSTKKLKDVPQLQAQCSSLLAEIELLKGRSQGHAEEILEASLRADKWQAKSEAITQLAIDEGVKLPENMEHGSPTENIASQLRNQLAECKAELLEARTEAAVARATAGAIISGKVNGSNIEEAILNGEDTLAVASPSKGENECEEKLTTELSAVSATIEQKEAIVLQMNKERAYRDNLQQHFENSLKSLQMEVDVLTAERDELVVKMSSSQKENTSNAQHRRGKRTANDPIAKRQREHISKLEDRINVLKLKASEHKKSMKRKEDAEKKCARLMAEIAEDKRRRADLQRRLKEASVEMRAEKKAARQNAAKMMKDKQKLKIELTKMKNAAEKQAAVLKRKIDQASAREKARVESERKRQRAEKMRLASSSVTNGDINEDKKAELATWIDREIEYSMIKYQIDDQRCQMDKATLERRKLMKTSGDTVDLDELSQLDAVIQTLRLTVQDLETVAKKAFPDAANHAGSYSTPSTFRFLETDKFKGLSKPEAKYVLSYIFDACVSAKQCMASLTSDQEVITKTAVDTALSSEQKLHEKTLTKIKMEHADATVNLLESTQRIVNADINLKLDADGAGKELRTQVDGILCTFNKRWHSTAAELKSSLEDIKETQDGLEKAIDDMAKGMKFIPAKSKSKKKVIEHDYDSEAFESEESFMDDGDGEDSEYEPTPAKAKKKRRSPRLAGKKAAAANSPSSPIGENFIDEIDKKRVGSLKKACKKLGVPVTGKKAELKERVRETILSTSMALNSSIALNSSMALPQPAEEKEKLFDHVSPIKKVNFEGDVAVDPEFQPIPDSSTPAGSIKKKLWDETDDLTDKSKPKPQAALSESTYSKTPVKMTPSKRKRPSAEKENKNSVTPKRKCHLGFLTSSPRPLGAHNSVTRTPVHRKMTIATAKKRRLVPDPKRTAVSATKRGNITASSKKRTQRGMSDAVTRALQQRSSTNTNDL